MLRTLIVDDSEVFRRSIRQLLASRFHFMQIAEAATVREALALLRAARPDLVFADIRLPDGSGLELARMAAAALPAVRCCMVTSFDLPEYRKAAEQCGARHFIPKATATEFDFVGVVDALLDHRFPSVLVDDDSRRRGAAAQCIARRWPAMLVFEASDLRSALGLAAAVRPWLVLVRASLIDPVHAPLCRAIKGLDERTTLVAVDSRVSPAEREWVAEAGADHAVAWPGTTHKPIAPIVTELLSRHRARRETA